MSRDFRSDNVPPPATKILEAALQRGQAWMDAYGEDRLTARLEARLAGIFQHEVAAFPILTGTAANALALAQVSGRFGQILCHRSAHIHKDECGAVEFQAPGNRLKPLDGRHGRLELAECMQAAGPQDDVHQLRTTAVSLSQATEFGTCYAVEELRALTGWGRRHGLAFHMDGTRFANVVAATGASPAELTWQAGIDVLCLGATKGGAIGAEAVIFFDRERARDFSRLMKRSGHLASRAWFLAGQLDAWLQDGFWLESASHANAMAARLDRALRAQGPLCPHFPVETNMLFLKLSDPAMTRLEQQNYRFYRIQDETEGRLARFVTAHATRPEDVDRLAQAILQASRQAES